MKILLVGKTKHSLETLARVLREYDYETRIETDDHEAVLRLQKGSFAGLVVGGDVDGRAENRLRGTAADNGVFTVTAAPGDREIVGYAREELVPALQFAQGDLAKARRLISPVVGAQTSTSRQRGL